MRVFFLIMIFLFTAQKSLADEFDARITVDGEGFGAPIALFFDNPDGSLGLVAGPRSQAVRYDFTAAGRLRRTPLNSQQRPLQIENYALGEDLIEIQIPFDTFGIPAPPPVGEIRRYGADGQLKSISRINGGIGRSAAIMADGLGGFWTANLGLLHINSAGNLTRISNTRSRGKSLIAGEYLIEYTSSNVFRTQLSLTPVSFQTTPMPANRALACIVTNEAQSMFGLATQFDSVTSRYSIYRLALSPAGFVVSESLLQGDLQSLPEIRCSQNRAALLTYPSAPSTVARELIMLDSALAIKWRASVAQSNANRLIAVGRNGEALMLGLESAGQPALRLLRFSARGDRTSLANTYYFYAAFDARGALYLTQKKILTTGSRLQVDRFNPDNLSEVPTQVFDLPAPIGAPIALAAAVENDEVQLLIKNPELPVIQHIRIDTNAQATVQFQRTGSPTLAQRFASAWLTQTKDATNNAALILTSDTGSVVFSKPIDAQLLACENAACDFLTNEAIGQIDRFGAVFGLYPVNTSGSALLSAPLQRASIYSEGRISRLLGNQLVVGPSSFSNEVIAQNNDGTHWRVDRFNASHADHLGAVVFSTPCPTPSYCEFALDKKAKRVFAIYRNLDETLWQIRETGRTGLVGTARSLEWPAELRLSYVQAVASAGELVWIRATLGDLNYRPSEVLLAIDLISGLQQSWILDSSAVLARGAGGDSLQFAKADRSFISVDTVSQASGDQLSVRRFEFNAIDSLLADGFE